MANLIPFEDPLSNVVFIGVLTGALLASLALNGGCMKFAINICGGSETGFFRSLLAGLTSWLGSGLAIAVAVSIDPDASLMFRLAYGLVGGVVALVLVLFHNPLRAFGTFLVFIVSLCISHGAMTLGILVLTYFTLPESASGHLARRVTAISAVKDAGSIKKLGAWTSADKNGQQEHVGEKRKPAFKVSPVGVNTNPYVQ